MDLFLKLFGCFVILVLVMSLFTWAQQRSVVYVAIVSSDENLSAPQILGAYYKEEKAEARIYQYCKEIPIAYSDIVKCHINPKRG